MSKISKISISTYLRREDIEGLIAVGAPEDEYDAEAQAIAEAIAVLEPHERTQENITSIIAMIWAEMFNRNSKEVQQRMPAFQRVAQKLLAASS